MQGIYFKLTQSDLNSTNLRNKTLKEIWEWAGWNISDGVRMEGFPLNGDRDCIIVYEDGPLNQVKARLYRSDDLPSTFLEVSSIHTIRRLIAGETP